MREGDFEGRVFIVVRGEAAAVRAGTVVGTFGAGDFLTIRADGRQESRSPKLEVIDPALCLNPASPCFRRAP